MGSSSTPTPMMWDELDSFHVLGVRPAGAVNGTEPAANAAHLGATAGPSPLDVLTPLWHPDNPMFWFGALLAVTFGLVAASTHIRLGPVRASVGAGDT